MVYYVYGDYGYQSENVLAEFDTFNEAKLWYHKYTRNCDLGGYSIIEVASFEENGEYVVHERVEESDYDNEKDLYWDEDEDEQEAYSREARY
jgi:hypothetical protein